MQPDPGREDRDSGPRPVAVVGAGISGLALSHYLDARNVGSVVLEAASEPGGVIRSVRRNHSVLDLGPQRTRLVPIVSEMIAALGLESELIRAPDHLPLFIYRAGGLREVPLDLRTLFTTDLLSWTGKLRLLLEPATGAARSGESVADCLIRKLGREAYLHLAGPLYGGVHGSDPAEMEVRHSLGQTLARMGISRSILLGLLPRMLRASGATACTFRSGMQALPRALHRSMRDRVRLESGVRAIRESEDGGWTLDTEGGSFRADRVVITAPAPRAAGILREAAPEAASRLARLRYSSLGVVHLHADCELRGMGFQTSLEEPLVTRGVTWNDSFFGRSGVYTAYLRMDEPGDPGEDAPWRDRLASVARMEFGEVTGCPARPIHVSTAGVPTRDRSWEALSGLRLPEGLHLCAAYDGRPGIPGRLEAARRLADRIAGGARL